MKNCTIPELVQMDFSVRFLNALQQFWRDRREFQCIDAPKRQNLLLFPDGCSITYTDRNNVRVTAGSGDVILTAVGSEYRAVLSDFRTEKSSTIGINFLLFDEKGEELVPAEPIEVFHSAGERAAVLFREMLTENGSGSYLKKRILLMEILSSLASGRAAQEDCGLIFPALTYLNDHPEEAPSAAELAEMCHISEAYFRRRFKAHTGVTPVEFRNDLRLKKAAQYLEYGDISVQELSGMMGYATVSHFIQQFGKKYGCSPLTYRKRR